MEEKMVSVIVPIYNCEKYIERCIDSLLKQTYNNLEIILIDDGSTDNSGRIIDEYSKKDTRIKVFHQENRGVANARNKGIEMSSGDYVAFVDSDDWVDGDYIDTLLTSMLKGYDIAICGYYTEKYNKTIKYTERKDFIILSTEEALYRLFKEEVFPYQGILCNKMFKLNLIRENDIIFNEGIHYNEDRLFIFKYILTCEGVCYSYDSKYHYYMNDGSAVNNFLRKSTNQRTITELDGFQCMYDLHIPYDRVELILCSCMFWAAILLAANIDFSKEDGNEYYKHIKMKVKGKWKKLFEGPYPWYSKLIIFLGLRFRVFLPIIKKILISSKL